MALTVRGLAGRPDVEVRLLAGGEGADRSITWVHVSELDDPTPFLSGGELLLTTGLFVRPGLDLAGYVDKLVTAGVLGLGIGVGLSFDEVPAELVAAAESRGLCLLEVPRRTPFIALSRAVSNALAADEYAAVTRTFTAQQELTRAALAADSPGRLIRLLARKVDGWAVLLDERGAPVAVGGDAADARVPAVAVEVARLREHRGSIGAAFEIDRDAGVGNAADDGADTVSLQPVGAGPRRRAYLAVGRRGPLSPADRHLVNAAVMLLTLGLEQPAQVADGVPAVRAAALELALEGHLDLARTIATRVGSPLPAEPIVVLVGRPASPPARADQPAADRQTPARADQVARRGSTIPEWDGWDASQRLHPRGRSDPPSFASADGTEPLVLAAELDREWVLLAPAAAADEVARTLASNDLTVGFSEPSAADGLAGARDQARRAADAATARGLPLFAFGDIGATGLTALLDPEGAEAFAESLLASLVEHDRTRRGDLVESLRVWLRHHGQWDPAAAALGVHRHTLRRRMGLVGELLGRDLDSPTVRSELWLALTVAGSPADRADGSPPSLTDPAAPAAAPSRSRRRTPDSPTRSGRRSEPRSR